MGFEQTVLDRGWDEGISRLLGQVPSSEHRINPNLGAETPVQIKHNARLQTARVPNPFTRNSQIPSAENNQSYQ